MTARISSEEMLARLVAFDTTSRNSNLALIDFVAEYLAGHGVASERLFDSTGAKANLFATLGAPRDGGIVLSGHTDVVPVDGQPWTSDPFRLVERGGRLYARGSADMKGFLAVALALVPEFLEAAPAVPIHLALSHDEETGCLGAPRLVACLRDAPFAPAAAIVGEPTEMRLADRHKSIHHLRTTVTGLEAHSAHTDRGVSAILVAGRTIAFLDGLAARFRERADPDSGFDPPYHTLHVGTVAGGTAGNILAARCSFSWEARLLPGGDFDREVLAPLNSWIEEEILPAMHRVSRATGVATERAVDVPALAPRAGSPAEALIRAVTGDNRPAAALSFGTEAGLFQHGGIPCVVFGPGSIHQAHKADEYIERGQVAACESFMRRLMAHLKAP